MDGLDVLHNMKTIKSHLRVFITAFLLTSVVVAQGVKYDELLIPMKLLLPKNIKGVDFVPLYIKPKKEVNFTEANFRLSAIDGRVLQLEYTKLKDIPINELNHEDINYIKEVYHIKLWIPRDPEKYKGWLLKHDLEKGSTEVAFSRVISNKSIEDKRKEYKKEAEQAVHGDAE